MAGNNTIDDYLHSWNDESTSKLKYVRIEDDIRDALQGAFLLRPRIEERKLLLELDSRIGIDLVFIGFPAASTVEKMECLELIEHIATRRLPLVPILMARAKNDDLIPIIEIQEKSSIEVIADLFINTSPLRLRIENWNFNELLDQLASACEFAALSGLKYRIAFEDSSRTPPDLLKRALIFASELNPDSIVLNDTVGDSAPQGVVKIVEFAIRTLSDAGKSFDIVWHGHNDKGLALANAMAAARAGASIISGTFLGIGERSGNIPLEQLIYLLNEVGNSSFCLKSIMPMCRLLAYCTGIEVPINAPLVGQQSFATGTGTHAAAIVKARSFGVEFEDSIFSGVYASKLLRKQQILIGPNSGRNSIREILKEIAIPETEILVERLLHYCKHSRRCLNGKGEILSAIQNENANFVIER